MTQEEEWELQKAIILNRKEDEEMKKVAVIILFFTFGSAWLLIPLYLFLTVVSLLITSIVM